MSNTQTEIEQNQVCFALVGEIGVGKTTLAHSIENMINEDPFEQRKLSPIPSDLSKSETQQIITHEFSNEKWKVKIIDTPGLSHDQGTSEELVGQIFDYITKHEESVAVCFLLRYGTNRLNPSLRSLANLLKRNFSQKIWENFILCLIGTDIPLPGEDTLSIIKELGLPDNNIIAIDNKAYLRIESKKKSNERKVRTSYEDNQENLELLLEEALKVKILIQEEMKENKETKENKHPDEPILSQYENDKTLVEKNVRDQEINKKTNPIEYNNPLTDRIIEKRACQDCKKEWQIKSQRKSPSLKNKSCCNLNSFLIRRITTKTLPKPIYYFSQKNQPTKDFIKPSQNLNLNKNYQNSKWEFKQKKKNKKNQRWRI